MGRYLLAIVIAALPVGQTMLAREFVVSSAAEIAAAMRTAAPGDALLMTSGTWTNQRIEFSGEGNAAAPITLRAQSPGQVILNGNSKIRISGDWLVVDGLRFEGGGLGSSDHIVEFRGARGEATNSRFTNSTIVDYNPANQDIRYHWVSLYGERNRVDHNRFQGQNHSGVTVVVWRNSDAPDHHQIDGNHFVDRPTGNANGFETIRIGTSSRSLSDSFTIVENNLFERTDGEIEIISSKSGGNIYRHNTFRESAGTLTLRHGNDNVVAGNFFLGQGKDGSGGVRVIGERHLIVNNYFNNLDGRADGAISISAAVPDSPLNGYKQVKDVTVAHNTIAGVREAGIIFDHGFGSSGRTLRADRVTVENNIVFSNHSPLFEGTMGESWEWDGNIAFGQSLGAASGVAGIRQVNPMMSFSDGLFRLLPGSPAIDNGVPGYDAIIDEDIDGQPRIGVFDIGADEFFTTLPVRRPLTPDDVGPFWLRLPVTDFDGNGKVDGQDFLRWQTGFGITSTAMPTDGDANHDRNVDTSDLQIWQAAFGSSGNLSTVPEPTTILIAAMLFCMSALGRRTGGVWGGGSHPS